MKKILVLLMLVASIFAIDTNFVNMRVAGISERTIPLALGASVSNALTGTSSITLNIATTTGRGNLSQWAKLSNTGVAISTVDVILLDNLVVGDIVLLQTTLASEDVVFVDDGSTIYLGAATRTLSAPGDILMLQKFSSTAVREINFVDNE